MYHFHILQKTTLIISNQKIHLTHHLKHTNDRTHLEHKRQSELNRGRANTISGKPGSRRTVDVIRRPGQASRTGVPDKWSRQTTNQTKATRNK